MNFLKIMIAFLASSFLILSATSVMAQTDKVHDACPKGEMFDKSITVKEGDRFAFGTRDLVLLEVHRINAVKAYNNIESLKGNGNVQLLIKGSRGGNYMNFRKGRVTNMPNVILAVGQVNEDAKSAVLCLAEKKDLFPARTRPSSRARIVHREMVGQKSDFPNLMDAQGKKHIDRTSLSFLKTGKAPAPNKKTAKMKENTAYKVGVKKELDKKSKDSPKVKPKTAKGSRDFSKTYARMSTSCDNPLAKRSTRCKVAMRGGLVRQQPASF